MDKLACKNANRIPTCNRQHMAHNNKNKPLNNKPKPSKDKLAKPHPHKYPTRLNTKAKPQKEDQKHKEEQPKQLQPCEQTKSTEKTQESQPTLLRPSPIRSNHQLQDYKQQIIKYVTQRQHLAAIDTAYLRNHKMFTPKMRSYLVRHFFKIYRKYHLKRSTLHLAVHYMDLYFCRKLEIQDQLETVSIAQTCLFIAMKYEEIYPPELASWVDRRHIENIIKLEADVLNVLDFQLAHYTLEHFMGLVMQELGSQREEQPQQASQLHLLMDLTMFDLNIRQFKASQLATCIYELTHEGRKDKVNHKIALNVKWMIERNQEAVAWLVQQKYSKIVPTNLW